MGSSGKGIGIVALLLALGALSLGVYQLVFASPASGGASRTYIVSNSNQIDLNLAGWRSVTSTITYNTEADDLVLLEYSCLAKLDILATITYIQISFVIDTVRLTTSNFIFVRGEATVDGQDIYDCAIMRYYIQSSTVGEHTVSVDAYIDDSGTTSYIRSGVLTVTVY